MRKPRYKTLLFQALELLRTEMTKKFHDTKEADAYIFANLSLTVGEIEDLYLDSGIEVNTDTAMKKLTLTHIGRDGWDRPVYKDADENLYVDVDPRTRCKTPDICTKSDNEFDGEPDTPIAVMARFRGIEIEFVPERDTWR